MQRCDLHDASDAALEALSRAPHLDEAERTHLCALARRNGVTADEPIEALTHLAFYAGWPKAMAAIMVAKDVLEPPGWNRRRTPRSDNPPTRSCEPSEHVCAGRTCTRTTRCPPTRMPDRWATN